LFLAIKRFSVQTIYPELVVMFGPYAIDYSTVSNYFCQLHFSSALRETPDEPLHGIHWNPFDRGTR
jgi:hypothetical protein